MTYETYRLIFYVCAGLAGLMLVISIILFFTLKIPQVIGDLTGSNARKAIEQIRAQNEGSGEKTYKSSAVNKQRGRVTDKISPSGGLHSRDAGAGGAMHTERIGTGSLAQQQQEAYETTLLANETTLLEGGASETTVLGAAGSETTVLNGAETLYEQPAFTGSETTVLSEAAPAYEAPAAAYGGSETTVLSQETYVPEMGATANLNPAPEPYQPAAPAPAPVPAGTFAVEFEITITHSDVMIA